MSLYRQMNMNDQGLASSSEKRNSAGPPVRLEAEAFTGVYVEIEDSGRFAQRKSRYERKTVVGNADGTSEIYDLPSAVHRLRK